MPSQGRREEARLQGPLDAAVAAARAVVALDLVGRAALALLAALAVMWAARRGASIGLPLDVVIAIGCGAAAAWATTRAPGWHWPDRLSTARSLERRHTAIGESISRAVAIVPAQGAIGRSLEAEAIRQAADALAGLPPPTTRERIAALRWFALAVAAAVVMAGIVVLRVPSPRTAVTRPGPPPGSAAARRLMAAARLEQRLATRLLERFMEAPGTMRWELSLEDQAWLDRTADLLDRVASDMAGDRGILAATMPQARADDGIAAVGEQIRGNRLAAAAQALGTDAERLEQALAPFGPPEPSDGPPDDLAGLWRHRLEAVIDAGGHPPPRSSAPGPAATPGHVAQRRGESGLAPQTDGVVVRSGGPSAGSTGDATSGDGGPSGGVAPSPRPGRTRGSPAWSRGREQASTTAFVGPSLTLPERYRLMVDAYYRELWEAEAAKPREASP